MSLAEIEERINADALREAESLLASARARAADISADASARGAQLVEEALKGAETEGVRRHRSAVSQAGMEARKMLLAAKQRLIENVFDEARQRILDLPGDEYFAWLTAMIIASAPDGAKELLLSSHDADRLPSGFAEDLDSRLQRAGISGSITLASQPGAMAGGFLLKCGGVEINGTVERLFYMIKPELELQVAEWLGL